MNIRALLVFLYDLFIAACAWGLAYFLRFNFDIPPSYLQTLLDSLWVILAINAIAFWRFGLYRGLWRFASLPDLRHILMAVAITALAVPVTLFLLTRLENIPRSVLVLNPLLLILMMGGSRLLYRAWKEGSLFSFGAADVKPVLVLGTGDAAAMLLRELTHSSEWGAVGLLDDRPENIDRQIFGVTVLGPIAEIADHASRLNVTHAIMAMPLATNLERRHAIEAATAAGLSVLTIPPMDDLISGKISISKVRKIEIEDLLGREQVMFNDPGLQSLLANKRIIVTGAGGSIGSELCRQIAHYQPDLLILLELSEFALYRMSEELSEFSPDLKIVSLIGDVKNEARLDQIFKQYRPDIVFHAAAYKHVPLMETENAWEVLRNNAYGTLCLNTVAQRHNVHKLIFISTDKAVNPTNVMGASKRLAEQICRRMDQPGGTRFTVVRFGNVLDSTGSVIPKFREQIARGGPVTVTHPDIIRYFMLIPEAVQLVLQAGLMGEGGETFVLDMGEPIRIVDLARHMIRLSGFMEDEIQITFTGLRPGEKLYEELLSDDEQTLPTTNPKLRISRQTELPNEEWFRGLLSWLEGSPPAHNDSVKNTLKYYVHEYSPQLDQGSIQRKTH